MYFALDIGGSNIRIAASEDLSPSLVTTIKIPSTNNYKQDFANIVSSIKNVSAGKTIEGIGCGFPGTFSEDKKTILVASNLPDWNNKQFVGDLEAEFNCPVYIENDDTVSALGETIYGQGKEKDFVYVTWGTGFGAAQVIQSEKISVKQFEAGHQIIRWDNGRQCGCGQKGCVEAYIGGGSIEKYHQKNIDELGNAEWKEILNYLANALVNIIAFYPTRLIIIGGEVAINHREKQQEIENNIKERIRIYPPPEVCITELGDDLGLLGALALFQTS